MNQHLEAIKKLVEENSLLTTADREVIAKALSSADKQWSITDFKLDRTEKVKRTTAILLEETIAELELKRKAIEESNAALQKSLEDLKAAQKQLIQSEKMASLGELTAGIAHEIQNPLNFVNNFSEVSAELIDEATALLASHGGLGSRQRAAENSPEVTELLTDIKQNLEKINHHGKRADAIVKGMLQHSRATSGEKQLTDLNVLCEEYIRIAYHGFRGKDHLFYADVQTILNENVKPIAIVPQDIGKVLINLLNNAFYAVREKLSEVAKKADGAAEIASGAEYIPKISVAIKPLAGWVLITVADNGKGIADKIISKIFQPFFTTKPTGQGTGLGLSLAYDIIKAHGGELKVETVEDKGSEFVIQLPLSVVHE